MDFRLSSLMFNLFILNRVLVDILVVIFLFSLLFVVSLLLFIMLLIFIGIFDNLLFLCFSCFVLCLEYVIIFMLFDVLFSKVNVILVLVDRLDFVVFRFNCYKLVRLGLLVVEWRLFKGFVSQLSRIYVGSRMVVIVFECIIVFYIFIIIVEMVVLGVWMVF